MAYRTFAIPVINGDIALAEMNAFLRASRVIKVEKQWIEQGTSSLWAMLVEYNEGGQAAEQAKGRSASAKGKIDYREVLPQAEFVVYAKLRDKRKELADKDGIPPFMIFTNEQLADMVRQRATSRAALGKIDGIGEARLEKYAATFLEILTPSFKEAENRETAG